MGVHVHSRLDASGRPTVPTCDEVGRGCCWCSDFWRARVIEDRSAEPGPGGGPASPIRQPDGGAARADPYRRPSWDPIAVTAELESLRQTNQLGSLGLITH